jgi:inhibitor of KinA sporulation pathway (predicted exonuclease)
LPEKFPKYCMDLKQWAKQIGAPRESFPKQEGTEHNALDDARWNMQLWNHLHLYEHDKMLRALRFQVNAEATDHDASVTLHRFRAGG